MYNIMEYVFLCILLTEDVLCDNRNRDYYEEPHQSGKSFFFLGGLIRKFKSRWQNPNQPPSPYDSGPIYPGYYGCAFHNCRPPQPLLLQAVSPMQPVQQVQPIQSTIVQTPIVVQQAQVLQPNTYSQAVTQQNPDPAYLLQPGQQQFQYPSQPQAYGNTQPAYGNMQSGYGNLQPAYGNFQPGYGNVQPAYGVPQPYRPYSTYPSGYGTSIPGQIYQSTGCTYPVYCGRKN